jgi:hypothetical protein
MPIRPSVTHSYKHLIPLQRSPRYSYIDRNLNLRVYCYNFTHLLLFLFIHMYLNKYRNVVYEVTDVLHTSVTLVSQVMPSLDEYAVLTAKQGADLFSCIILMQHSPRQSSR